MTASPSSAAATRSCQSVHIVSANGASSHPDQPRTSAAAIAAAQSARRKAVKSMLAGGAGVEAGVGDVAVEVVQPAG